MSRLLHPPLRKLSLVIRALRVRGAGASRARFADAGQGAALPTLRRWMHTALLDLPRESAILAVGCDATLLAPHLAEYSGDVTILDPEPAGLPELARRFPDIAFLRHHPAKPLPFARDTFDAVWCCELLDRVIDPAGMLRHVSRVLAPGGRLLVSVPDRGAVRKALTAVFPWEEHFARWRPQTHTFTRIGLAKLAREVGFGEIHTNAASAVRPLSSGLAPRTLLLRARKEIHVGAKQSAPEPADARLPLAGGPLRGGPATSAGPTWALAACSNE